MESIYTHIYFFKIMHIEITLCFIIINELTIVKKNPVCKWNIIIFIILGIRHKVGTQQ